MKVYKPKAGNTWNPLNDGKIRNMPCPCGSKKKVKKCHGASTTITNDWSKAFEAAAEQMRNGKMVVFQYKEDKKEEKINETSK